MSHAKRRATRNKAYMSGYAAARAGRDCLNPYIPGTSSGAWDAYTCGWICGVLGGKPYLERAPVIPDASRRDG